MRSAAPPPRFEPAAFQHSGGQNATEEALRTADMLGKRVARQKRLSEFDYGLATLAPTGPVRNETTHTAQGPSQARPTAKKQRSGPTPGTVAVARATLRKWWFELHEEDDDGYVRIQGARIGFHDTHPKAYAVLGIKGRDQQTFVTALTAALGEPCAEVDRHGNDDGVSRVLLTDARARDSSGRGIGGAITGWRPRACPEQTRKLRQWELQARDPVRVAIMAGIEAEAAAVAAGIITS